MSGGAMNGTRLLAVSSKCPAAMHQRESWSIHDFAIVKEIGSGAVSCVYYALCKRSCLRVAIKVYNKPKLTKLNTRQVEREIAIHSSMAHPHVVDFYAAFEDAGYIYLVLEYAEGGDLFDAVKRKGGRMPESAVVQQVLYPYLCALLYMHKRGIIHRDVKPENTVFTRENVLKVTDFGLAINTAEERAVTRLGTLDYMAPEVLRCPDKYLPGDNKERIDLAYSEGVDAWAMGILAYELIVGRPPFGMADREGTMRAITQMQPSIPDWVSEGAASFIVAALDKAAPTRAPIARLIQHPWIVMYTMKSGDTLLQQVPHLRSLQRTGSGQLPAFPSSNISFAQRMQSNQAAQMQPQACSLEAMLARQQQQQRLQQQHATMSDALMQMSSVGGGSAKDVAAMSAALRFALAGQQQAPMPLQLAAMQNDLRPAKRVLQRSAMSCLSDGSGGNVRGGVPMAKPGGAAQTAAQAYWCTYGPGWTGMHGADGSGAAEVSITDAGPGSSLSPFGDMLSGTGTGSLLSPLGAMLSAAASGASLPYGAGPGISSSSGGNALPPSCVSQEVCMTPAQGLSFESVEQTRMRRSLSFKRRMPDEEPSLRLSGDLAGINTGPAGTYGTPLSPRGSGQQQQPDSPTRVRVQPVRSSSPQPAQSQGGPSNNPSMTAGCPSHQAAPHQHQPSRFSKIKQKTNDPGEPELRLSGPLQACMPRRELQHSYSLPAGYNVHAFGQAATAQGENPSGQWLAAATSRQQQLGQPTPSLNHMLDPMMTDWRGAQNLPTLSLQSHPLASPLNSGCNSPMHNASMHHLAGCGGGNQSFSRADSEQSSVLMAMAAAGGSFQAALDALQVQNLTLSSPSQAASAGQISVGARLGTSSEDSSGSYGGPIPCSAAAAGFTAAGGVLPDPYRAAMSQDPVQAMPAAQGNMSLANAFTWQQLLQQQQQQTENQRVQQQHQYQQQVLIAGGYRNRPTSQEGANQLWQVDDRSGWHHADGLPAQAVKAHQHVQQQQWHGTHSQDGRCLPSPCSSNTPSGTRAAAAASLARGSITSSLLPCNDNPGMGAAGTICSGRTPSAYLQQPAGRVPPVWPAPVSPLVLDSSSSLVSPSEPQVMVMAGQQQQQQRVSWMLPSQSMQPGALRGRDLNASCDSCATGLDAPLSLSGALPLLQPGLESADGMEGAAALLGDFNPMDLELLLPLLDQEGGEGSPSSKALDAVVDFMNSEDEFLRADGLP